MTMKDINEGTDIVSATKLLAVNEWVCIGS
jgi:hypothetical protein